MFILKKAIITLVLLSIFSCAGIEKYDQNFQLPAGYGTSHKWIGEKVVFLPQQYGIQYYSFKENAPPCSLCLRFDYPSYNDLVGKTAEIIGYKGGMFPKVILKVDTLNWILYTQASLNLLNDVGFLSEMENAKQFVGQRVWNKGHPTDANADRYGYIRCSRKIGKFEDVVIRDIKWSSSESSPLMFIFEANDGLNGYWDGSFSRINDGESHLAQPFEENWYFKDPHIIHSDWHQRVWHAIENEKIFIGMTEEQAILSWGKPREINKSVGAWGVHEQWIYGSQYLYFENGKLTSFQNN